MNVRRALLLLSAAIGLVANAAPRGDARWWRPHARNPILPGYFADPTIVRDGGEWFIFATRDPWGGNALGLWRSHDFRNWRFEIPNWPTKQAATSPTSGDSMVWAPSVVKGSDGRFWMYVSVGSEIWVGVADRPGGPWRDAHGGKPLIPGDFRPGFHMIDAEAFVDDDGTAYLYWGSGLHWVNGRCFMVQLKPDMMTFVGPPRDVTPAHYFEAPFLFKHGGRYFLTYSYGNTTTDTYQVRYAVGSSPFGPFTEPRDLPILATDARRGIVSPGHHAIFQAGGRTFILYHRQALPVPDRSSQLGAAPVLRQIVVDELMVDGDRLEVVRASHGGPDIPGAARMRRSSRAFRIRASSATAWHEAERANDDNYATSWRPTRRGAWIEADLGAMMPIRWSTIRLDFPDIAAKLLVQTSDDRRHWRSGTMYSVSGSPIFLPGSGRARYLRITFLDSARGVFDWRIG